MCSLAQGIAGAQAGASIVNANVGRTRDFYNRNPGLIRDPKVGDACLVPPITPSASTACVRIFLIVALSRRPTSAKCK